MTVKFGEGSWLELQSILVFVYDQLVVAERERE